MLKAFEPTAAHSTLRLIVLNKQLFEETFSKFMIERRLSTEETFNVAQRGDMI